MDADNESLPTASTGGDATKESKTVSRGNRGPPPQITRDMKQGG